jgi:hypothetical protein
MNEVMTIKDIESRFDAEWVLVGNPSTDAALNVQAGEVLAHSPDRDKVYRQATALKPARFALLFTGRMPEGTAIVL